jgi:4-amino-4-deoxy-L-arabinose transferase-like glycosyltransferase
MIVAYGAMALGVLSKGLLGLVLPLLAGAVYALATGPLRAAPARLRLLPGLGVFLAIVLAWYGPAVAHYGTAYFYETLVHQHMVRYTRTWAHEGPWYYYFGEFPSEAASAARTCSRSIRPRRCWSAGSGTRHSPAVPTPGGSPSRSPR